MNCQNHKKILKSVIALSAAIPAREKVLLGGGQQGRENLCNTGHVEIKK